MWFEIMINRNVWIRSFSDAINFEAIWVIDCNNLLFIFHNLISASKIDVIPTRIHLYRKSFMNSENDGSFSLNRISVRGCCKILSIRLVFAWKYTRSIIFHCEVWNMYFYLKVRANWITFCIDINALILLVLNDYPTLLVTNVPFWQLPH